MKKEVTTPAIKQAQKEIKEKTKNFESDLVKAKNAFERVLVFDKMSKIIGDELQQWINLIAGDVEDKEGIEEGLIREATIHVAEFEELLEKIASFRSLDILDALKIQQAMKNSHQLKEDVIFE